MVAVCTKERCDYATFLLRLVERESLDREKRAAERRIKNARFPVIKTLDTFDFGLQPSINEKLVRELMTGQYLERRENILLVGNSGTGKTHLASALGFAACMQSRNVRFFTVKALGTPRVERTEPRQQEQTGRGLERQDLLILDAEGYGPFSQRAAEWLCERVHILEANGPSYRLRESQRRLKRTPSDPEPPAKNDDRQTEPRE